MTPRRPTLILLALWCAARAACAQEPIFLLYNHRPPYMVSHADGSVSGLTATPAARALRSAGIPYIWQRIPTNRQLWQIKADSGRQCAIGWFKKPDREQFAKFTKPLYQDKPTVGLAHVSFRAPPDISLAHTLSQRSMRVLVKDQYSYGPYIDGLLTDLRPTLMVTTSENVQMVQMIQAHRADLMFASEEEASYLIEQAGFAEHEVRIVRFAEMPKGEKRHLMCSKAVPDELIERINRFLPDQ